MPPTAPATQNRQQSTATAAPAPAPAQDADFLRLLMQDTKTEVSYRGFATSEDVTLSIPRVRKYVAAPYPYKGNDGKIELLYPDDVECAKFILLCRARQLNPYEGDAFMVPFWDKRKDGPAWALITAHFAFLKRAEVNPNYDGMESGIIVLASDKTVQYREGDFKFPGDEVIGGWADVYRKDQSKPNKKRVNMTVYNKGFGNWISDPAGMICKVAEAQALRDCFPTLVGGLYLREEIQSLNDKEEAPTTNKRPTLPGNTGPGTTAGKIVHMPPPEKTTQKPPEEAKKAPEPPQNAPDGVKAPPEGEKPPAGAPVNAGGEPSEPSKPEEAPRGDLSDEEAEAAMGLAPAAAAPAGPAEFKPTKAFNPNSREIDELREVRYLLWKVGHTEAQLLPILQAKKLCKADQKLEHLSTRRLLDIAKSFDTAFAPELAKLPIEE